METGLPRKLKQKMQKVGVQIKFSSWRRKVNIAQIVKQT